MPMRREDVAAALKYLGEKADLRGRVERAISLDPQEQDLADLAVETGASFIPGVGPALAARDVERARRANDPAGMAMAAASAIPGERLAKLLGRFDPTRAEIFIGKSAKTWDANAAKRAEDLEAAGMAPEKIWQETGTYRGPDGQLRQEIPDEMAFKPTYGLEGGKVYGSDVNEAVFHPAMRKAYPDIMEETLTMVDYKPNVSESGFYRPRRPAEGAWKGRDPEILVRGKTRDEMKSVMAHELQHAVQEKEGFARGGNPDQFSVMSKDVRENTIDWVRNKIADLAAKKYKDAEFVFSGMERGKPETLADPEIKALMKKLKSLEIAANPREQYKRLAGEAEARATQARRGMTMEQRRATFPLQSYDVPINELIK